MTNKAVIKAVDLYGGELVRLVGNDGGTAQIPMNEFAIYVGARYAGALAGLPSAAANKWLSTYINDSAASPVPYAAAAGGGSLTVPVYSDGTIWRNA